MSTSVFTIDRCPLPSRAALVDAIKYPLGNGSIVEVEDSSRPRHDRRCYGVASVEGAIRLVDAGGQHLGLFTTLPALVDFAEKRTRRRLSSRTPRACSSPSVPAPRSDDR